MVLWDGGLGALIPVDHKSAIVTAHCLVENNVLDVPAAPNIAFNGFFSAHSHLNENGSEALFGAIKDAVVTKGKAALLNVIHNLHVCEGM